MIKPTLLRDVLTEQQPFFKQNPERLEIFVTEGNVIATGTTSNSFLYEYKLNILALDYPYDMDSLSLPILKWVRVEQPDLIFNPDKRNNAIRFDADILDNETADILFVITLTERVVITEIGEQEVIKHLTEPQFK